MEKESFKIMKCSFQVRRKHKVMQCTEVQYVLQEKETMDGWTDGWMEQKT